jgi:hypothetical protein
MKSSSSFTPSPPQSTLIIGVPGSGKTTLALNFPKPFLLDCDGNLNGPVRYLTSENRKPNFLYDSPTFLPDGSRTPLGDVYQRSADLLKEACESKNVETIIIDSATSYCDALMRFALKTNKLSFGTDLKTASAKLTFAEWGIVSEMLRRAVFWLKGSGKKIVWLAHKDVDKDELTGALYNFISIPTKNKNSFAGWFEEVWELVVENTMTAKGPKRIHKLRTAPLSANDAPLGLKSSLGWGSSVVVDADFMAKLKEGK